MFVLLVRYCHTVRSGSRPADTTLSQVAEKPCSRMHGPNRLEPTKLQTYPMDDPTKPHAFRRLVAPRGSNHTRLGSGRSGTSATSMRPIRLEGRAAERCVSVCGTRAAPGQGCIAATCRTEFNFHAVGRLRHSLCSHRNQKPERMCPCRAS